MDNLREAVDWVLNDAAFKAPEQLNGVSMCWIKKLQEAIDGEPQPPASAHDGFEKYRKVYAFEIPKDVLFDWLVELGWSTVDYSYGQVGGGAENLVQFHAISDPEDSAFSVLNNDWDTKDSLAEAIKKAYFKLQDDRKRERREQYEELKKEFEPGDTGEASK
jgi:hypothetical protein